MGEIANGWHFSSYPLKRRLTSPELFVKVRFLTEGENPESA
jgi:hypothetical protein